MSLLHVDFVPRMLQSELQYSTLSLTCCSGGPKYDDFSILVERANDWLKNHRSTVHLLHVEVLEIDGVYATFSSRLSKTTKDEQPKASNLSAFLKLLRLWYTRVERADCGTQSPSDDKKCTWEETGGHLDYVHITPSRLESTPRSCYPKFQSLQSMIEAFNARLQRGDVSVKGPLISAQTAVVRFISENCVLDPERTFWMFDGPAVDVHLCFYITLFFLRSDLHDSVHELGFKDFAPKCSWVDGRQKSYSVGGINDVIGEANEWLAHSVNDSLHPINMQTVDHYTYFRCARDTPGYELKTLNNSYFRAVFSSSTVQFTKFLRIYYCSCTACCKSPCRRRVRSSSLCNESPCTQDDTADSAVLRQESPCTVLCYRCLCASARGEGLSSCVQKSFHIDSFVPVGELNMSWSHLAVPTDNHRQQLSRINDWISSSGAALLGVETIKICLADGTSACKLTAEDSLFHSSTRPTSSAIYAIRLYASSLDRGRLERLEAEPKYIRLRRTSACSLS